MRDIKFKIYDKELKESHIERLQDLCEDDYWYDGETDMWSVLYDSHNEQERFVALQYTGLKDKNDTEIYEGDIVHIPDDWEEYGWASGENYAIDFKEGRFRLKPKYKSNAIGYDLEHTDELEVIGNIYDNPELIKEAKI